MGKAHVARELCWHHETHHGQTAGRSRCATATRSVAARNHDRRGHARSDRSPPWQHRSPPDHCGTGGTERPAGHSTQDRRNYSSGVTPISLIVDSGPLYAYIDGDDHDHEVSLELLESHEGP